MQLVVLWRRSQAPHVLACVDTAELHAGLGGAIRPQRCEIFIRSESGEDTAALPLMLINEG